MGGQVETEPTTSVKTAPRKIDVKKTPAMRICVLKGFRQLQTSVRIKSSQVQRTKDLEEVKKVRKLSSQQHPGFQ